MPLFDARNSRFWSAVSTYLGPASVALVVVLEGCWLSTATIALWAIPRWQLLAVIGAPLVTLATFMLIRRFGRQQQKPELLIENAVLRERLLAAKTRTDDLRLLSGEESQELMVDNAVLREKLAAAQEKLDDLRSRAEKQSPELLVEIAVLKEKLVTAEHRLVDLQSRSESGETDLIREVHAIRRSFLKQQDDLSSVILRFADLADRQASRIQMVSKDHEDAVTDRLERIEALLRSPIMDRGLTKTPLKALPEPQGTELYSVRRIYYATDRRNGRRRSPAAFYLNERSADGSLSLGTCEVSIPPGHRTAALESPRILRLEFRPNPEKHVVLLSVRPLREDSFYQRLAGTVQESNDKSVFVFIHGYNVSFADGARRTAQLAHDLDFHGAAILYSWASQASLQGYPADEETVRLTVPRLVEFLSQVAAGCGVTAIHVIAHSMGNRALTEAFNALVSDTSLITRGMFHQIVLAAPDINVNLFRQLAGALSAAAKRVTLYACASDKALAASKTFHSYRRAGESITLTPGIDIIDATAVDTSFLGHGLVTSNRIVMLDLESVIKGHLPPDQRSGLEKKETEEGVYYAFRA